MSNYILDVGEGYIRHGLERTLAIPVRINEHEDHWMDTRIPVTPYTAPDLEQVRKEAYEDGFKNAVHNCPEGCPYVEQARKEAYEKGYNNGYEDTVKNYEDTCILVARAKDEGREEGRCEAWEAARKIALDKEDGGLDTVAYCEIFGYGKSFHTILKTFTASEVIAKIKEREDGKQEDLHVGDVVTFKTAYGEDSGIVVECHVPDVYPDVDKYIVWCGGKVEYIVKKGLTKTGTHFPEVADLLKKMKDE